MIPIKRPMDYWNPGTGEITIHKNLINGKKTKFLQEAKPKDLIVIDENELKILQILSDNEIIVNREYELNESTKFKIHPSVDNTIFFEKVLQKLKEKNAIGFFPEGETHETPGLIEFKQGIALLVMKCFELNIPLKIQCFAYSFSYPDTYLSKVQLTVGESFVFDKNLANLNREEANNIILSTVRDVTNI